MPQDREHDIGLPHVLLDALCDLAVMEQPLGERRLDEMHVGRHPIQREDTCHVAEPPKL